MRFERERDIPAFKGKPWWQKWILGNQRNLADELDPWIPRLRLLRIFLITVPLFAGSYRLAKDFFPNHYLLAYVAFACFGVLPVDILFQRLVITPRIRKALESNTQPA